MMYEYVCHQRDVQGFPTTDDPAWNDLPVMKLGMTVDGATPTLATTVVAFWTKNALYFRFCCEDDGIVATMTERDDPIYKEDVVEVFLSETGSLTQYKEFEMSPANVQFDAAIHNLPNAPRVQVNVDWDAHGWRTAVYPDDDGNWSCVWEIPFDVFSAGSPSVGDVWRMNCYRIDRVPNDVPNNTGGDTARSDQYQAWSPTGVRSFHVPQRFGRLRFTR